MDDVRYNFSRLGGLPLVTSGRILQPSCLTQDSSERMVIVSGWSQRDFTRVEKDKLKRTFIVSGHDVPSWILTETPPEIIPNDVKWQIPSLNGKLVFSLISSDKQSSKNSNAPPQQYLKLSSLDKAISSRTVAINEKSPHGKVYEFDAQFTTVRFSPKSSKVLYVAEKFVPKSKPFFPVEDKEEEKFETVTSDDDSKKKPRPGLSSEYRDDWGEQLTGECQPLVCVFDVFSGDISVLDFLPDNISCGQACWIDEENIALVGFDSKPYRLGLIFCSQRPSALYTVNIREKTFAKLTDNTTSVNVPCCNHQGSKIAFLRSPLLGPHRRCEELVVYDTKTGDIKSIVDIVRAPVQKGGFPGIYCAGQLKWTSDGVHVLLSTIQHDRNRILVVNTETGAKHFQRFNDETDGDHYCDFLYDVSHHDVILFSRESSHLSACPMLAKFDEKSSCLQALCLTEPYTSELDCSAVYVFNSQQQILGADILLQPATALERKPSEALPLVVIAHGGPHSTYTSVFSVLWTLLVESGYAVYLVNYSGSLGFGEDCLESLPGHIGSKDVNEVQCRVEKLMNENALVHIDRNRVYYFGGSHGGFIGAHLVGQFPELFKAVVLVNPVINLASMLDVSDIPDWIYVETGVASFEFQLSGNPDAYKKAFQMSPISHVDKVTTPTLLVIGDSDRRVPPSQGHLFYRALKARGIETRFAAQIEKRFCVK